MVKGESAIARYVELVWWPRRGLVEVGGGMGGSTKYFPRKNPSQWRRDSIEMLLLM